MDKNEILEKSQQENRNLDERDRQIELTACKAGYRAILFANGCIILLLTIQDLATGEAFVSFWPFVLTMLISETTHDFTLYRYHRKTVYLVGALIGAAAAALAALCIIMKASS